MLPIFPESLYGNLIQARYALIASNYRSMLQEDSSNVYNPCPGRFKRRPMTVVAGLASAECVGRVPRGLLIPRTRQTQGLPLRGRLKRPEPMP